MQAQEDLLADSLVEPANEPVKETFKTDYIVNGQSNETMRAHRLALVIVHRFDDLAGSSGGIKTFFGLDNSTDIKIGFTYGISNRLMIGLARAKGAPQSPGKEVYSNSLEALWEGTIKYKLLQQTKTNSAPVGITLFANAVLTSHSSFEDTASDLHFGSFSDRWSFTAQAIISRKFSKRFSLALTPAYLRRNFVAFNDQNDLLALGIGARYAVTPHLAILVDYFHPFRKTSSKDYFKQHDLRFYDPLGVGLEIYTGGHIFHLTFTNSTAIIDNQFIPYTSRSWSKGEFRWGFSISRMFAIGNK